MLVVYWWFAAFFSGSLMFSYWIGRLAKRDVREVGDGNPGGINLWKAAGPKLGIVGIALDFAKGYVPVLAALSAGFRDGYALALIAAAPVAGHLFSPFLKFRGGKGIAVTFGVWSALTGFRASLVLAATLLVLHIVFRKIGSGRVAPVDLDGFEVSLGVMLLSVYLVAADYPAAILEFWLLSFMLILYAHRQPVANTLRKWLFERHEEWVAGPEEQEERGKSIGG
jgi:acyl-phosphate glycerol 3-phosphate acyltransferase